MKKNLLALFIGINIFFSLGNSLEVKAENQETYFIVTAYYSPLPNQDFYLKGDYEKEIYLNGQGIKGASGKGVFPGMLAAPKKYSFGTKIYLEGIGIGVVEDRGGAIVEAGKRGYEYDRIDVWMGYGQEGLLKALKWGKRKVKGYIVDSSTKTNISLNETKITENKKVASLSQVKKETPLSLYEKSIGKDSSKDDIKELQKTLQLYGLYNGKLDGIYNNEVINIILNFQKNNNLIKNDTDAGAGYWGIKTRNLFAKQYKDKDEKKQEIVNKKEEKNTLNIFEMTISPDSDKEKIILLQSFFKEIGKYSGETTGKYSDIKDTLISYQIDKKIVKDKNEVGVGYFGPKTRQMAKSDYDKINLEKKKNKELAEKKEKLLLSKSNDAKNIVSSLGNIKFGETSQEVREFQKILKILGYFNYDDTATFGDITKKSLISYQIKKGIIKNEKDDSAGIFGPKTKENLTKDLANYFTEKELKGKELAMK
ncbi:hypothetical protein HGA92_04020 [Candidatus Gracilibacteria bacterium]|nr:hypothetical protein [Candidatus Gracilibacteria bacterium]NUJ99265.1 hypothetical protein [Candidatus Gracilibacteria bacterium]